MIGNQKVRKLEGKLEAHRYDANEGWISRSTPSRITETQQGEDKVVNKRQIKGPALGQRKRQM